MSDNSLSTKKAASLFQAAAIFILTAIAAPAFPGGDGSVPSFFFLGEERRRAEEVRRGCASGADIFTAFFPPLQVFF